MAKKKDKPNNNKGLIYSTDPEFDYHFGDDEEVQESLPSKQQKLRISLDKKQRAGKEVTLITGFQGLEADLNALGKSLKTFCGVGGSVKNNEILLQGDHRKKVLDWLLKNNYTQSKISGI
jgi:translation initiation factor 1